MKKKIIISLIWVLILAVGGGFGGAAWAGHHGGGNSNGGHHKIKGTGPMKILEKLNLTQKQQEQIDAIIKAHQEKKQVLSENIKNAEKAIHETIHADTFDEKAIRNASKTLSADMEEMAVLRGKIFAEIRPILTPEQIKKLSEMSSRHHKRMKHMGTMKE